MNTIAVLGTHDTKGSELDFVAQRIREEGFEVLKIDVGTGAEPQGHVDISREQVLSEIKGDDFAGNLDEVAGDRGACVAIMGRAAAKLLPRLIAEKRIDAIISLGGGGGTSIGTAAMRAVPIGIPKLMVSTMASGDTSGFVGTKDIVMMPSIVDVAGLNRVSQMVFSQAAAAICGMARAKFDSGSAKPIIVASMFGNTTQCIEIAKPIFESAGYEVLVFHATGTGGRAMEDLIASGMVSAVFDITTTELADELVGGVLSAGPDRLGAAARAGIPTVIAPGCLDMANFGRRETVPKKFQNRTLYQHNPDVTLLRTSVDECKALGTMLAEKADAYHGPVTMLIPTRAISVISAEGQPFHDPAADTALFDSMGQTKQNVQSIDAEINDRSFAEAAANELLRLVQSAK